MNNVLNLAARNLWRYQRRTLLTAGLIVLGVMAVLVFVGVSGTFKRMMIGQITDSMLGHVQLHRRGYVASIDSLPLNLNLGAGMVKRIEAQLQKAEGIQAYSKRIKFGAMLSNYAETTSIRINGIEPDREAATTPLLPGRLKTPGEGPVLNRGEILLPVLLARGLKIGAGDEVVLIATNKDGSVNGKSFKVRSEVESVTGPGGRDGYIHIEDAREVLRMADAEVSEIAVRLTNVEDAERAASAFTAMFDELKNKQGMSVIEVHAWQRLTPFANIAKMIDLLTIFVRVMLMAIVLVSVMNVMIMAVYERIREIGMVAAIGTRPSRILGLFLSEGLLLGLVGTITGVLLSAVVIVVLNHSGLTFDFGQQRGIPLTASLSAGDLLLVVGMVITMAVLASLQPAWKASRMDPITALRHV